MKCFLIILATILTIFACLLLRQDETWVLPKITGTVVRGDGSNLPLSGVQIHATSSEIGSLSAVTDNRGYFEFLPVKKLKRSFLGDQCFFTQITASQNGFRSCDAEIGICGGELIGDRPPTCFKVEASLATADSKFESEMVPKWSRCQ